MFRTLNYDNHDYIEQQLRQHGSTTQLRPNGITTTLNYDNYDYIEEQLKQHWKTTTWINNNYDHIEYRKHWITTELNCVNIE